MQDTANAFDDSMLDLSDDEWLERLSQIGEEHGYFQPLGDQHCAVFIDQKPQLLVTFETLTSAQTSTDLGQPMGFDLVRALGWSHLALISDGDTWFRRDHVYGFFDRLIDDGFFEEFDNVVFYGKGSCGYAAAAYSVACPGSTVIAIQPQATLEPRLTHWDERFHPIRMTSFTDRYGFAPDMLEAAERAFVIYDPADTFDSMHAALYRRPNVTPVRLHHMGEDLETHLVEMQILYRMLAKAMSRKLTPGAMFKLLRARREYLVYLRTLALNLRHRDRPAYEALVLRNITRRMRAPRLAQRLRELEAEAEKGRLHIPGEHA
ncbi:phosphoadenosine phosphosulfate reductase [Donghicola sp. C2-DW-16]|uniref:Phosphoadenosine phosphosulfate reductase n=1 Tax=Donghicola mangrovi TaxID=2729614 RepID=A0A850QCC6_9RHOB|nr:phosphoadenosine phosphosulfate reductase [Donghicola mangrovi]NVO23839.1 phosphoadenosine phosphosulfate reductase [Donghicola mangrovi]NVO27373.1 phosphoadenosine phosphosulfate reductase [Donghicola mangrovi]